MEPLASPWFVPAMAVLCYLGLVLYGGVVTVSGRYADAAGWPLLIYYAAFFPTPIGSGLWIVQSVVVAATGLLVGPDIVHRFVLRKREYTLPPDEASVPLRQALLIGLPALAVFAWVAWFSWSHVLPVRNDAVALNAALGPVWGTIMILVGFYFAVAYVLGAQVFRDFDRTSLLRTSIRFHRMNGIGVFASPAIGIVFLIAGPYSTAGQSALLVLLLIGLAPGLNELAWSYDAVLTRIVAAHVVIAGAAAIVFLVPQWIEWLGGGLLYRRGAVLVVLAVFAMAVPTWIEERMLEWFFPRASKSRARLVGLMSEPLVEAERGEVATSVVQRLVDVLDAEGGLIVLPAEGAEPALVKAVGDVEMEALGSVEEIVEWVARVAPGDAPVWYETLPGPERVKMLFGGVVVLCPLGSGQKGAILLGPRRGWLYDRRTIRDLETVGRQARFAFDNLALLRGRAHDEKLAALGEAAARIAHEIRNPLAGARSLVQLSADEPGGRELAEPALEELDRIGHLVGELLAFARREDVLERAPMDLADACRDALSQLAPLCEAGAVQVETDLGAAPVSADRDRVVQVIANLARNAVESFSENGGGRLAVRCGTEPDRAFVEVRDDGPGIPPEKQRAIFEPFHTSKREGTGLGLAIARQIARAHGGELELLDSGESGSRFRLTVPTR